MKNKTSDFEVGKKYIINYGSLSYEQIREWHYPIIEGELVNVKKISSRDFTESDYEIIEMVKNKQNSLDTSYSQMWMLPYL